LDAEARATGLAKGEIAGRHWIQAATRRQAGRDATALRHHVAVNLSTNRTYRRKWNQKGHEKHPRRRPLIAALIRKTSIIAGL